MTWLEPNFPGHVGVTVADSTPAWRNPVSRQPDGAPNIVVVIMDDTGWSDFGCFGSTIRTPNIDGLAANGVRYSNYHVTPLCSPTRASLLTGRDHHSVGMRFLADADTGFPNSRGYVHFDVPMLPQVLRSHGYGTYLVGKWHLAPLHEVTPSGPFHNWPLARGFDRFYGFLDGCTDQYTPELYEDNHEVPVPQKANYHLTEDLIDHAITYVTNHSAFRDRSPFYLQLALGATHAPFQVPRRYIEQNVDAFAAGWDVERTRRLQRQIAEGLLPPGTTLTPREDDVSAWDDLGLDAQKLYRNLQAAFAGFLEHADEQLGRFLRALDGLGMREDTVVMIFSDNGASREGGKDGAVDCNAPYSGNPRSVEQQLTRLETIGGRLGPAHYPQGWAMAGNTPYRKYKQFVDLGGVRSPLIMSWPGRQTGAGTICDDFVHVVDIMPTILDLVGVGDSGSFDGASVAQTLVGGARGSGRVTQHWEMLGHRAIWHDGWKAVTAHTSGTSYDEDVWRLYHVDADRSEAIDVADQHPDVLERMKALWWEEAERHHAFPLDDRSLVELLALRTPLGLSARSHVVLPAGVGHLPLASGLTGSGRSMRISASLLGRREGDEGVVFASGSAQGGYTLYVHHDRLHFEHHALGLGGSCSSGVPVPVGDTEVAVELRRHPDRSASAHLLIDGQTCAATEIPLVNAHLSFWGADVGADRASQVSTSYQGEFPFPAGVLRNVTLTFYDPPPIAEIAEALVHIE